jgi:hypothetical protein
MSTGPQAGASSPLDVDTTKRSSEATTSGATPSVGEMPLGEIVRKTIDVRALLYQELVSRLLRWATCPHAL